MVPCLRTEAYRARFLEAMDHYFHIVPDQWTYASTYMALDKAGAEGRASPQHHAAAAAAAAAANGAPGNTAGSSA